MKQLFDLIGRVAIITGGSGGIGAATARLLAEYGADLVITGRGVARLEAVAKSIGAGRRVITITAEMSRDDAVVGLVDKTIAEYGHIDILVNNAGGPIRRDIENTTVADWESIMGSNLRGAFVRNARGGATYA